MTGQHERPLDAARPYIPPPSPLGAETRALLYSGPGATDWAFETRIREGAWDDIPAEFDAAHARVHLPAIKPARHIRLALNAGRHHLAVVFAAHPDWRTDTEAAKGLHKAEVQLQYQLDRMRREAAELETARRAAAESRVAA